MTRRTPTRCVKCGGAKFRRGRAPHSIKVGRQQFRGDVPAHICDSCGMVYFEGPSLLAFDLEAAGYLARRGASNGEGLRFMRKVLGLTAAELADLLSLAPETISRIEKGRMPADVRTAALIGAMVLDRLHGKTDTLERLQALRRVEVMREKRITSYREQLKTLPPGPQREHCEAGLREWLTMGPESKASPARLSLASKAA